LYAISVASCRVTRSRLALATSRSRRLAVFPILPSHRAIETVRCILLRAFAPLQSLARDSTLTLSQLRPKPALRRSDFSSPLLKSRLSPLRLNLPPSLQPPSTPPRLCPKTRPRRGFQPSRGQLGAGPPERCASARAHASHGVLRPLRDTGCGSPLGYPERSLDPDPREHHPDARSVPPTGFLSLSAACSSRGFAALFHAAATCRVSPSRGFPFQPASPGSSPGRALLPLPPHLPEVRGRNLGLPSMRPTDFRALLRLKVRTRRSNVTLSFRPIPSWDSYVLSRAFPLPAVPRSLRRAHAAPLMPLVFQARSPAGGSGPEGLSPAAGSRSLRTGLQRIAGQGAWPPLFPDATNPPEVCPPSC
jgi:hypothetical protein